MMNKKTLLTWLPIFISSVSLSQQTPPAAAPSPVQTPAAVAPAPPPAPAAAEVPAVPLAPEAAVAPEIPAAPVAPSVPPPSLKKYELETHFMRFDPEKNGVKILPPKLSFSVDESDDVILSGVIFNEDTFKANLGPLKTLGRPKNLDIEANATVLFITAPRALGQTGQIDMLSEDGKIEFSKQIQEEHLQNGQILADSLKDKFWNSANPANQINVLISAEELQKSLLATNKKSGFRFCWSQKDQTYYSRFCTPYYRYSTKDKRIKIQSQTSSTKVYVDKKVAKPSDSINVEPNKPKRFLATSTKGYSLEFFSLVKPLNLSDFYSDKSGQWVYLIGNTYPPTFPETKFFPAIDPDGLISFFRWRPTIGLPKDYWVSVVPKTDPQLILPGQGGGLFSYALEIKQAPSVLARIALKSPLKSTYSSTPILRGSINKGLRVSAMPPGKVRVSKSGQDLAWTFSAATPGGEQPGGLIVKEQDKEFQTFYSLYRGYSGEFSLRLAGVVSADLQLNLLGEVAYNQWFESLFGWENNYLSVQRWGISARHFAPLKTFTPKGTTAEPLTLKLTTFDLKYRLTQGLWERDETWGLILGAEDIMINKIHGTFGGAGFFWARSMPEIFDWMMNWIPFMDYPKWVDMEMLYYFIPLSSEVTAGQTPTYAVNFHGKILWTKNFFGEAGFGIKAYDYKTVDNTVKLQALYGTAGLGFNF